MCVAFPSSEYARYRRESQLCLTRSGRARTAAIGSEGRPSETRERSQQSRSLALCHAPDLTIALRPLRQATVPRDRACNRAESIRPWLGREHPDFPGQRSKSRRTAPGNDGQSATGETARGQTNRALREASRSAAKACRSSGPSPRRSDGTLPRSKLLRAVWPLAGEASSVSLYRPPRFSRAPKRRLIEHAPSPMPSGMNFCVR